MLPLITAGWPHTWALFVVTAVLAVGTLVVLGWVLRQGLRREPEITNVHDDEGLNDDD